jgi:thiol-disulfide isomerase/thioredoxin
MSKRLTEKNSWKNVSGITLMGLMLLPAVLLAHGGCDKRADTQAKQQKNTQEAEAGEVPRFAINSPFRDKYKSPIPEKGKRLWARSFLWEKAPDFVVEKWLTEKPETAGKYTLIEFWATWCSQCKLSIPKLNQLHRKFGAELVVIAVSDQKEEDVRKFDEQKIEYFSAIDTQKRMKEKLGVFGIPHVIIIEPDGYVVWEGFPLLKDYELTEEVIEKILSVRANKQPDKSVSRSKQIAAVKLLG